MSKKKLIIIPLIALLIGFIVSSEFWQKTPGANPVIAQLNTKATVLPFGTPLPEFTLTNANGQTFTRQSLQDKWTIAFIGFTFCPDVCPTTLATVKRAYQQISDSNQPLPQVVFISVDPERDTPQQLSKYTKYFHEDFVGVTGDHDELQKLTKSLGALYYKGEQKDDYYTVDHTASLFFINPKGQLQAILSAPHLASDIANDYQTLITEIQL